MWLLVIICFYGYQSIIFKELENKANTYNDDMDKT